MQIDDLNIFLPDLKEGKFPEKDFFFGICSTIKQDIMEKLIDQACNNRTVQMKTNES